MGFRWLRKIREEYFILSFCCRWCYNDVFCLLSIEESWFYFVGFRSFKG